MELPWKSADALCRKGQAYAEQGQYDRAVEFYDRAIQQSPGTSTAWYQKGLALTAARDHRGAIECFDQAIRIDPASPRFWQARGRRSGLPARR